MNHIKKVFILWLLLATFSAFGQSPLALPQVINYSYGQYKGGIQNWDVAQDKHGILYFGNNEGLLTFNGGFWKLYHLPNFTVVRSVEIDARNRIFIGGQDEIGYFSPNLQGVLIYHSLLGLLPEKERKFADVWNVEILGNEVFFRSITKIFHYKDNNITIYKPGTEWAFLGKVNGRLFAQIRNKGIVEFKNSTWIPVASHPILNTATVTSILDHGDGKFLLSTLKNGLFMLAQHQVIPFKTQLDANFFNDRIYCGTKVNKDWYAFGSTSAGILIINKSGQLVQQYSYQEGLQKSNIRALLIDRNKSLWAALDDGIDLVAVNNAIKTIFPDKNKQATGYAINLFKDRLYIGTSNGLYATRINTHEKDLSLSKNAFIEVKNAKGQVWSLEEINGRLLMGHEDGSFELQGDQALRISNAATWLFKPVSLVYPTTDVIAGNYFGLQHLQFKDGKFIDKGQLMGFNDSFRFLDYDNAENIVWTSHPNRGIYKIKLSADYSKILETTIFNKQDGLPSTLHNYLYRIKNRRVVATKNGLYEYQVKTGRFIPSLLFNGVLKGIPIQYLKEDHHGNVWFITNKIVGLIENNKNTILYLPELNEKVVGGFESIYTLNEENIFIGGSKGVYHINYKKYKENKLKSTVLLGQVRLVGQKDSIIFGGYFNGQGIVKLPHHLNSLHFEFSSSLFEQRNNVEFSYQLEGFDKEWAQWSSKTEKDYTNLSAGTYSFKVKSRNNVGSESDVVTYQFKVLPAWYQSVIAYLIYFLLLLVSIYVLFRWQQNKYRKAQQHLSYLHQLEVDRNEKEITSLKNEKLEADMDFKNRELATMTMNLIQRGEVLLKVKEVISTLVKKHDVPDNSQSFKQLLRLIREVEKGDEDKVQFTVHFNNVNESFFNQLKDQFPEITPNELKLCAYLKQNLSTKEVAQLMNITHKAVEVARYRLRKKLNLTPDVNLYDFLTQVSRGLSELAPENQSVN
jgi:ligand-binding sensor domain-containing protein